MTRTVDFRYQVIRNGAYLGELFASPDTAAPTLRMDESAAIKTSLSGSFFPTVTDASGREIDVDWLSDEIQPVLIIDGTEYPLGIYAAATVVPTQTDTAKRLAITAYDRCWRVRDNYTTSRYYAAKDTVYVTLVKTLLAECGISNIRESYIASKLAEAREWEIGTSYLDIINELLGEINYNPLWFNQDGAAVIETASVPTVDAIEHTIDSGDVQSMILPQISRETDVYSAPNVFVCVCSNPDKSGDMIATAMNTNPMSPLSISRRGRRIVSVVQLDNIASQAHLQVYANRLRDESLISGETVRVQTALLPGFGVDDVVALHYGDFSAICIERAWTMELCVGGTMHHVLEKVVYNLG